MRVRRHLSQHEAAAAEPILTRSATVRGVEWMDHSRNDEVVAAIVATLDEHGSSRWHADRPARVDAREAFVRDALDPVDHLVGGTPLSRYLPDGLRGGSVGRELAALQSLYLQPYPSLLRITVEPVEPIAFVAGQYLSLRYRSVTRVYSVSSSPNRPDVEFCVGRVPGGRMTSELAVDLAVGDEVTLRGPYGELTVEEPSDRDVVFLATGTGVAPFKSMIDYLFEAGLDRHDGEPRDVWLFLGAPWEDALPYDDAFRARDAERDNFHYVPTLSRERALTDWPGETAYVQYALVKYVDDAALVDRELPGSFRPYVGSEPAYPIDARLDPASMEVYACGLNAMVYSLVDAVDRLGVAPEHTQFEGFG